MSHGVVHNQITCLSSQHLVKSIGSIQVFKAKTRQGLQAETGLGTLGQRRLRTFHTELYTCSSNLLEITLNICWFSGY